MLAKQRLEFLGRDFEGHRHFIHEARNQRGDALRFLVAFELRRIFRRRAPHPRQPFGIRHFLRPDRQRGQETVQRIHGHRVVAAAVGEQEGVEFVEFLVGKRFIQMHDGPGGKGKGIV